MVCRVDQIPLFLRSSALAARADRTRVHDSDIQQRVAYHQQVVRTGSLIRINLERKCEEITENRCQFLLSLNLRCTVGSDQVQSSQSDQMSILRPYSFRVTTSGAIQSQSQLQKVSRGFTSRIAAICGSDIMLNVTTSVAVHEVDNVLMLAILHDQNFVNDQILFGLLLQVHLLNSDALVSANLISWSAGVQIALSF
ncbi:hypothetical protein KCV03_g346, partial [Aureobasidium melanogenum]